MRNILFSIFKIRRASLSAISALILFSVFFFSSCEVLEETKLAPIIVKQPVDTVVAVGQTATFLVEVEGTNPLSFQWYKNGETIVGATGSKYVTPLNTLNDDASKFTVTISNSKGSVGSDTAVLTIKQEIPPVITFITEGTSFSPLNKVDVGATILWTWADQTTSNLAHPTKNYGSVGKRANTLVVTPWSALKSINIGYDGGDGGSSQIDNIPNQNVSKVKGLQNVAPYLEIWCSSYNRIDSLDFSNFVNIHTIECYFSQTLKSVNLNNTPKLKRACFEDCDLSTLDFSQSPALEDLRGAVNNYPTINFGTIGQHVWHICVRDNPQMSDQNVFEDLTQFPEISELFIWNDNQTGSIRIPSTSSNLSVSIQSDGNHYTNIDLSGALQNAQSGAEVIFQNNEINNVNITGCVQICVLNLHNNNLSSDEGDEILTVLDGLGRNRDATPASWNLSVNLRGNDIPGNTGYTHAQNLANKGWTIETDQWTLEPGASVSTGADTIYFTTNGAATSMRCDFAGNTTATWYWSDGTTTTAVSGQNVEKTGLGAGNHEHYLIISNGASLNRFGASTGGGNGHLVSIGYFNNSPSLRIIYAYNEPLFTSLGRTNLTKVSEYHLMNTALSESAMDQIFADAVATNVLNGTLYCNNMGTNASANNRGTLQTRGWNLN
jgi:hypothetical protein